jgi:predicted dinucleotide-binding enzyme
LKLGIIGARSLGTALGERYARCEHSVMFGGGASAQEAASRLRAQVGSNSETATFGDVVILAVPFAAIDAALADAGPLRSRVLWSCVNALKPDYTGLAIGFDNSAAEEVARRAPGARVVAAVPPFAQAIAKGPLVYDRELEPTVFICGDDRAAKRVVESLVSELGAQAVDAGPLDTARLVEPAMMLTVSIAYSGVPRDVSSKPKRVLIVVANPTIATTVGWPVGFWGAELTHPYLELSERGVEVTIASPDGGKVELDALSDPRDPSNWSAEDLITMGFVSTRELMALLEDTPKLADVDPDDYDAIMIAGGLAPMFSFRDSRAAARRDPTLLRGGEAHLHLLPRHRGAGRPRSVGRHLSR